MFNTLKYARKLEDAGVSREQAEVHIQIIAEVVEVEMATKQDLKELDHSMKQELKDLEYRLTYKICTFVGAFITLAIGAVAAASKFL